MKKLVFACLLEFSLTCSAITSVGFTDGHYLGVGDWRDDAGNTGSYEAAIEFINNNPHVDYTWNNSAATVELSFAFDAFGDFTVFQNENVVGEGYCMSIQCTYSALVNNLFVSETFTFLNDKLYKLGTEVNSFGTTIYWEEDLSALQPFVMIEAQSK